MRFYRKGATAKSTIDKDKGASSGCTYILLHADDSGFPLNEALKLSAAANQLALRPISRLIADSIRYSCVFREPDPLSFGRLIGVKSRPLNSKLRHEC